MSTDITYREAGQKAERFFAKSNFPLAKKEFEKALQLQPSAELQEKIRLCSQEIDLQKRKDTIKRGRRLESRGQYRNALKCFEQAVALREEDWLVEKIGKLQEKLRLTEVPSQSETAAAYGDSEAIRTDDTNALSVSALPEQVTGQAASLVRTGSYQQAIDLLTQHPPANDAARYYFGYAFASTGQFVKALEQWNAMEDVSKDSQLWQHYETLLPFVCRELHTDGDVQGYAIAYQSVQKLVQAGCSPQLADDASYVQYNYIEALWNEARYTELVPLLPSLPDPITLPLLGLYARVYYKLAEQDPQYLEMAITFWLTAIYNDRLLQSLSTYEMENERLNLHAVRETLLRDLETLMHQYDYQAKLPDSTRLYWQLEKRLIHELAMLPLDHSAFDIFPCTPAFADKFGLSEAISTLLNTRKALPDETDETFFEVGAYYSKAGRSLMLIEQGEAEQALAVLPKNASDDVSTYCRQRVLFHYGLSNAREGAKQTKKYFLEALPLLKQYAHYGDELAELVLTDLEPKVYAGLADAMEALSKHIATPKFLEATAYAMSIQAMHLRTLGVSTAKAGKLLDRALAIYPESQLAKTSWQEMHRATHFDQINKAFKRQNLPRAVNVVHQAGDPELIDYFFEAIEIFHAQVQEWDQPSKLSALREFHTYCAQVDRDHPLTLEMGSELGLLERS
jgi:tetratricopeptide (TPR) repeat protein